MRDALLARPPQLPRNLLIQAGIPDRGDQIREGPAASRATSPVDAPRVSLDRNCAAGTFGIRETLARQRLIATDTAWSAGGGRPVRAPIGELLLLATGRSRP
ncbi:hypothetical protein ACFRAQ_07390 [Nocardia sp. NPDC056611]|uniref:hypothetical protein n=1 Tax=Nocardia sp. NPDC056611 TaxID=3345877 RepID=UPI0036706EF7